MPGKRAQLSLERPSANLPAGADAWVEGDTAAAPSKPPSPPITKAATAAARLPQDAARREPIKRLTIDIPESLHREMKIHAATTGTPMVDEVRALLEAHYRH